MTKAIYPLTGMRHCGSEEYVKTLPNGYTLTLVREPNNPHDPFAVQVWVNNILDSEQPRRIAYIKATEVKPLADYIDKHGASPAGFQTGPTIDCKYVADHYWPSVEVEE